LTAPASFGGMLAKEQAADALADDWLRLMGAIAWEDAAKAIRQRAPFPTGETTSIEKGGVLFDVSDSWRWQDSPDGGILLSIEVFECGLGSAIV
jgi:hypothetical protein